MAGEPCWNSRMRYWIHLCFVERSRVEPKTWICLRGKKSSLPDWHIICFSWLLFFFGAPFLWRFSRVVTIRTIRLHPRESDFYNALYTQTRSSFDDYVSEGTLLNNYVRCRFHLFWQLCTPLPDSTDSLIFFRHIFLICSRRCARLWIIHILLYIRRKTRRKIAACPVDPLLRMGV